MHCVGALESACYFSSCTVCAAVQRFRRLSKSEYSSESVINTLSADYVIGLINLKIQSHSKLCQQQQMCNSNTNLQQVQSKKVKEVCQPLFRIDFILLLIFKFFTIIFECLSSFYPPAISV